MLAEGSGNIVDVIKNLQTVVTTLRDSNTQIVQFQDRLATLTSVINDSSSDLDGAIANLSVAIGEVKRFIAETRDPTSEQIQRLGNVTQILVDNKTAVENVLHISPTAFANGYNIYNPDTGDFGGGFTLPNFSSPVGFVCGSIGALENTTAPETAKLCAQYLGPALRLLNFNYIPIPTNPYLMKSADPNNIVYADPSLAPGGPGPQRGPRGPARHLGVHRAEQRRRRTGRTTVSRRPSRPGRAPPRFRTHRPIRHPRCCPGRRCRRCRTCRAC